MSRINGENFFCEKSREKDRRNYSSSYRVLQNISSERHLRVAANRGTYKGADWCVLREGGAGIDNTFIQVEEKGIKCLVGGLFCSV